MEEICFRSLKNSCEEGQTIVKKVGLIIKIELGRAAGAGPVEAALSRGKSQMSNEGIYYTYYENGWGADEVEFRFYLSDNREVQKAVLGGIDGKRRVTFAGNKWFALELNRV